MPVKFYLHPRPNKKGEYPIRVSISIGYSRLLTSISHSVAKEAWDDGRGVKARYTNSKGVPAKTINADIAKIQAHFTEYEINLKAHPSVPELKEQLNLALKHKDTAPDEPIQVKPRKTVFSDFDEFVKEQGIANQWAYATLQCWKTFRHHLENFNSHIHYEDFDEAGLNRFIAFLRTHCSLEEKTAQKQYSCLKWFLNWAIRKGYCKEEHISKYRPKFKIIQKPIIFLTKEELLKLYNYTIPANGTEVILSDYNGNEYTKIVHEAGALSKTRDLFCFCAFTSLRYSDMAALKRKDIIGNHIYITTKKTNDRLPIDLNSFAQEILNKYKNEKFPDGLALPVISNQKMNNYLKDLCELCGFNEPITKVCYRAGHRVEETFPKWELVGTHAGRRTFICFALASGIPPQVVMKWTGHSDYKAMKPYIEIAEKTKADAMSLFEKELKK